ncbi:MAG: hypothetical protein AAFY10_01700 [Pseudomonadota bacterium]
MTRHIDKPALELLRASWRGDSDQIEAARAALEVSPGRARGRVAGWAITRAVEGLRRWSRRGFRAGETGAEPTPHERSVLAVCEALREGDLDLARQYARWLVSNDGLDRFIERISPAAPILAKAARAA